MYPLFAKSKKISDQLQLQIILKGKGIEEIIFAGILAKRRICSQSKKEKKQIEFLFIL
jgi:hypothetical protein